MLKWKGKHFLLQVNAILSIIELNAERVSIFS